MEFRDEKTLRPKTVSRWQDPFPEAGGWVVHLRYRLEPEDASAGLRDTLTAWTREDLERQMREQDRQAAWLAAPTLKESK